MTESQRLLSHALRTIRYRSDKCLRDAPQGYLEFSPPAGIRMPGEILQHMCSVLTVLIREVTDDKAFVASGDSVITKEYYRLLEIAELELQNRKILIEHACILLQGPISDVLTHVGQLAMLRRMYGAPLDWENFMKAEL